MKNLRCVLVLLALAIAMAGCGSAVAPTDAADPVSVNTLDGAEGVPVDGTFKYAFSRLMTPSTVTTSTFFMVKKVDEDICDPTQAIDATVECSSPIGCTLTPADMLEYSTVYSICLMGDMQYATGVPFEGFMATFTAEEEGPLSLNDLDGAVDVPVNSSFRYRFLKEVNASTVDASTYFIVPTVDPAICDVANAVASEVTCTRWSCTIAPSAYLEYITGYTACLTSGISYTSGSGFSGFMASFTTGEWILSSIKLVRLDDTELELTDRPIPRMVHVKLAMSVAVIDESERTAFESAVSLVDEGDVAAGGTFEWAADFLSVTFTPSYHLKYGTEYTISVDTSTLPLLSLSKALENQTLNFTTMTYRDINGDGFADALVGAYEYGAGTGRVYLFHGSTSGLNNCDLSGCSADTTVTGKSNTSQLGFYISSGGDVNADGYADVVLGATGYDNSRGQVYILLGSASGIANCDLSTGCNPYATITGASESISFGMFRSMAGDVNGDGYDDIVIGAEQYGGVDLSGGAFVFHGGPSLRGQLNATNDSDSIITGKDNSLLGTISSGVGDVNGDGYDDLLVSAKWYPNFNSKGQAYVFLGSESGIADCDLSDPTCVPHATITGKSNGDELGQFASPAGDVNGDGYDDIIVSAYGYSGWDFQGQAYILLGSASGITDCDLTPPSTCAPHTTITGENLGDLLGWDVSNAGDVNGDGYDDVIVGALGYTGPTPKGQAYVFLGSGSGIADCDLSDPTCVPHATIMGKSNGDEAGAPVSSAGDVDGDGYDDIMVGSIGYDGNLYKGQAYLFRGSGAGIDDCDLATCSPDATLTGETNGDRFGQVR